MITHKLKTAHKNVMTHNSLTHLTNESTRQFYVHFNVNGTKYHQPPYTRTIDLSRNDSIQIDLSENDSIR